MKLISPYRWNSSWGWWVFGSIIVLSALDHGRAFGSRRNDRPGFHDRVIRVESVLDGSSVRLKGGTVARLIGVDAPASANSARAFLEKWVQRPVRLVLDDRSSIRDKDDAVRAYLWADDDSGLMLNEELVRLGLSRADRESRYAMLIRFEKHEEAARRRGIGIWVEQQQRKRRGL